MTQKRILLYLEAANASWIMIDEAGQTQQIVLRGNLSELTPLATDCDIQVVVPGESILLTSAQLPKLNAQRLKQAIPFALEEQLIDDVNDLHFAIGDYQPDNSFPVAVVTKEKMDAWLGMLKEAGITPRIFIPATLALPFTLGNIYACINNEIAIVRTGFYSGFACEKENFATLLELHLADMEQQITGIHIYNFSSTSIANQLPDVTLNEIMINENQFLENLLKWTVEYPFINLLQGDYQIKTKTTATKKIWIGAACLALAWIAVGFFENMGSFFILHHATSQSEQQIEAIYKRNFPQASAVVAPKERMEEKLKRLTASGNKNNFLSILGIIARFNRELGNDQTLLLPKLN